MKNNIEQLRTKLEEKGIDAIVLTSPVSHKYFTRFDNGDATLLITKDNAYAYEDFRYTEVANKMLSGIFTVIQPEKPISSYINEVIEKEGIKKLGIENYDLSLFIYEKFIKKLNAEYVNVDSMISDMREVKAPYEIEKIAIAQEITDAAFSHILKIIKPTMTENDVAAELEYFMRKNGAQDKSFETIAVSGKKSSMPHGVPSDTKLEKGFLTMDFGALYDGYHADMTRTVCIGKATKEMKDLYNTVLRAQLSALEYIKDGLVCASVDKVARDIIDEKYEGCFGHSLGHGVGLEIHEEPRLSQKCDKILQIGNVVTVEPGIYVAGKFGCRIEDMVLIKEGGIRNFTKSPKELIEIY